MNSLLDYLRNLLRRFRPARSGKSYRPAGIASWAEIDNHAKPAYDEELVVIEAIVGYDSPGGWSDPGFDVRTVDVCAWRRTEEPLREDKLVLLVPLPEGKLWSIDLPQLSIWRMNVLLSKDRDRAVVVAWEPAPGDATTEAVIRRLREPVVVRDEALGDLTLDRVHEWFVSQSTWNGDIVRVTVEPADDGSSESARATAANLWADQGSWTRRIEEFAVDELLDNANDWVGNGETKHTREGFLSRLKLKTISLRPEGEFEFWYDDGDLFWGHTICVRGDVTNGPRWASFEG